MPASSGSVKSESTRRGPEATVPSRNVTSLRDLAVHPFSGLDVAALVALRARTRGAHPFLIWAPFDGPAATLTYAEFHGRVRRLAAGLAARGIRPGDRVLIHLENSPESLLSWCACADLGAVAVTTN